MTYFICISVRDAKLDYSACFPAPLETLDITNIQAGRQVIGGQKKSRAAIIAHKGCSTNILNRNGKTPDVVCLFREGLKRVCSISPYAAVLVHFFRGDISRERIVLAAKVKMASSVFINGFPDHVVEDTKYTLMPDTDESGTLTSLHSEHKPFPI